MTDATAYRRGRQDERDRCHAIALAAANRLTGSTSHDACAVAHDIARRINEGNET